MGKKKGRGRGRPKDPQNEPEERIREPGSIQRESNTNINGLVPRAQNTRDQQFQDVDCEHEQLAVASFDSKTCTRPQKIPDDCRAVENAYCNATKLETKCTQRKTKDPVISANSTACSISSQVMLPSTSNFDSLGNSLTSTALFSVAKRKPDIIKRPNFGNEGRPIALVSNYFLLKGSGQDVYHYHVEITDKSQSAKKTKVKTIKEEKANCCTQVEIQQKRNVGKQKFREVISQLIKDKSLGKFWPFYDGYKNLYSFGPLFNGEGEKSATVTLCDNDRKKTYTITVKPVKKACGGNIISLETLNTVCSGKRGEVPLEAITAFDMILCHREPLCDQVGVGRSFFSFNETKKNPMDGLVELWNGYNGSLQLTQRGPAVLVNKASKAFHCSGFVIEHACNVLGFDITERELSIVDIQKLTKSLRGIKVEVTHLKYPRRYTVESVTKRNANTLKVDIEGREMSVSQFFAKKYKKLKFPDLPCLSMRTTGKPTYTPMEVCVIFPGQPKIGKPNQRQTADMIRMTAVPPSERFNSILNYVKEISEKSGSYIKKAGYDMQKEPVRLTARVISAPALEYKGQPVQPDPRGVWRIDGKNFSAGSGNAQWILISFAPPRICPKEMLEQLATELVNASKKVGLHLNHPKAIKLFNDRTATYNALLEAKRHEIQFVFAILSRGDRDHSYEELKFIADVKLGLITQCMEDIVVPRCCGGSGSGQILNNVLSKLNIKLGGINHTFHKQLSVAMKRTVVMGADAAHSPRGSKCPSIAAVVGSIDDVPFQYAVSCRVQMNRDVSKFSQEIILHMKEMTKHVLRSYRNRNGCTPERIIFFRDGVSQGQFATVLEEELPLIKEACCELFKRDLPITFIIVQKRHQTRFIPSNPRDGIGKQGNIPPGTTVDTDVTHPVYFDYFLCSHEGIKGTSKPAHYVVLHDDNKFKADEIQKLSYDLCHVYARCNRSISIPAPAMNAHLAAARAKKYVELHISSDTNSSSGYSSDGYELPPEVIDFVNKTSEIKAPMFFV